MIMTMHTQPTEFCVRDFPVLLFHWGAADTKYNSRRNYDILLWNEICKLWKLTQKEYVNSRVLPVPLSAWLLELVPWICHSGALTCSCPVGIAVSHPTTTHPHQDRGGTPALHPHNHWFLGCCSNKDTPGQSRLPICILHRQFCWPSPVLCMQLNLTDEKNKQTRNTL